MSEYDVHGRVGVLVPPENPTVEPEMTRLMPATVSVHSQRLPVFDVDLRGRIEGYNSTLDQSIAGFGGLRLDCFYYAMTGGSYLMGRAVELATIARFSREGTTFVPAGHAIVSALQRLGIASVALISPYPDWLTEAAVEYWTEAGLRVVAVGKVPTGPGGIYALSSREVIDVVRGMLEKSPEALLLSGTGMPTIAAAQAIAEETDLVVLSSAIAAAAAVIGELAAIYGAGVLEAVRESSVQRILGS